jgi:hypothetical protein
MANAEDAATDAISIDSSDSDQEGSTGSDMEEVGNISISSDVNINKMAILPNSHPSPPPTVEKRKRGRKPKSSKIVDEDMIISMVLALSQMLLTIL